jgi:type VI secretion system activator RovC-like protein
MKRSHTRQGSQDRWGVPDWHAGGEYPSGKVHNAIWSWEFARRNPEYRHAWKDLRSRADSITAAKTVILDRFGFSPPCDPTQTDHRPVYRLPGMRHIHRPQPVQSGKRQFTGELDEHEVAVVFDLTWPLDQQLERARSVLELCQSERSMKRGNLRMHKSLFANYLRILDAKDAGATEPEIAGVLFPRLGDSGLQRVKNHYRAAKSLRDGGYLWIAGEHVKLRLTGPE